MNSIILGCLHKTTTLDAFMKQYTFVAVSIQKYLLGTDELTITKPDSLTNQCYS